MIDNLLDLLKLAKYKNIVVKVLKGLLVIILFFLSSYLQYIPVLLFRLDITYYSSGTLSVILSAFSSIIFMIFVLLLYRKDLKNEWKIFKDNLDKNLDVGFAAWVIGLIIMFVSNFLITLLFKGSTAQNEVAVQSMIKALPALMFIDASIIAPINEEIVFRKTLKDVFKNKYVFMALSFLLFGGAHVFGSASSLVDYLYIIPYGSVGAAFAYMYYKTDTVFTSMTMHFMHNTILVLSSIILNLI